MQKLLSNNHGAYAFLCKQDEMPKFFRVWCTSSTPENMALNQECAQRLIALTDPKTVMDWVYRFCENEDLDKYLERLRVDDRDQFKW